MAYLNELGILIGANAKKQTRCAGLVSKDQQAGYVILTSTFAALAQFQLKMLEARRKRKSVSCTSTVHGCTLMTEKPKTHSKFSSVKNRRYIGAQVSLVQPLNPSENSNEVEWDTMSLVVSIDPIQFGSGHLEMWDTFIETEQDRTRSQRYDRLNIYKTDGLVVVRPS